MRELEIGRGLDKGPLVERFPLLFLYGGVALAVAGRKYPLAEKYLHHGLNRLGVLGPTNPLRGMDALDRKRQEDEESWSGRSMLIGP